MPRLGDDAGAAGFSLVTLETVDSTNRLALDLAEQAGANKTWVVAATQRAGRGRHGRVWASPPGNLYVSLLLVSPCKPADSPKLGFVAGLALIEALHAVGLNAARLKWPNDAVVDGSKLAGLLLEGRLMQNGKQAIAIGIGVNVASSPMLADNKATSLSEHGIKHDRREVFRRLSNRFAHWFEVFNAGAGFANVRQAWLTHALPLGTALTVKLSKGPRAGTFAGVDGDGRLLLSTAGGIESVEAGDVFLTEGSHG